ncbi:acyltransferase family protein [Sutcliffiella deserti]|uniref:acyltransferase family protein n=1 Tax=Sutcliffiella deserti TaxID=2875501 RepID=UPI001CBD1634|nr:acyltransferase [Sutcliffiella deserti]
MAVPEISRKLSILQVARVCAILLVVISHINVLFYRNFEYDWLGLGRWDRLGGVDFFFVVTGFMIYYIYHRHFGVKGMARDFLLKRVIRIFPLYWLFTLILLGVAILFPMLHVPYSWDQIWKSMILFPSQPILTSAWSMSHVIFFYLMFTLVLVKPNIFKPIIGIWVLTTILLKSDLFIQWETFFFSFSTLEIVAGTLIAYVSLRYNMKEYASMFLAVGVLGYVGIWLNNFFNWFSFYSPILYCFFALIIVLGISIKDRTERKIPPSLIFLGDASYSIYIAHGPFLIFYMLLFRETLLINFLGYTLSMVIITVLTIISCCFVYVWIEKPMNGYLRKVMIKKKKKDTVIVSVQTWKGA